MDGYPLQILSSSSTPAFTPECHMQHGRVYAPFNQYRMLLHIIISSKRLFAISMCVWSVYVFVFECV